MSGERGKRWRRAITDLLVNIWNALAYKRPVHPDEGFDYSLTPRWRRGRPSRPADRVTVELDERDRNCIKWAVPIIQGVESNYPDMAGVREGEAMSDVLAAIVARADLEADRGS